MSARCQGWVADAVPLQRSSMSKSQNVAKNLRVGRRCGTFANSRVSQNLNYKKHMQCLIEAMHVSCCVCVIYFHRFCEQ